MTDPDPHAADLLLDRRMLAPHAVARWAADTPDRVAVEHVDGERLTWADLHEQALRWAGALRDLGADTGTHVGTFLPNSFDSHRALLAIAWLRAIEVPINPAYTGRILRHALDHADVSILVTTRELAERLAPLSTELASLRTVVVVDGPPAAGRRPWQVSDLADLLAGSRPAAGLVGPECWDIAALQYTSGTTGQSKAVITPWAAIHQIWSWVPPETLGPGEGLHCALPVFHMSGRGAFNHVLARGGRFVMRDKFSATHVWDETRRTNCVALSLVGPLTSLLHSAPPRADDADNPVRHVLLGPMIPEIERFEARFGVKVAVAYGQTEIGVMLASGWDHGPPDSCGAVRDGYPWPEVRIVDEHDRPLGPGEVGELIVRTRAPWALNAGYYKMPQETVAAWRNGWFHTGDALRYDEDGRFYFVDRLKDAIRRRGENISSFEVENLVTEHPQVVECAAVGVDAAHGDQEILIAVVVKEPSAFDPGELLTFLAPRMPQFMLPRFVDVVDDLPRSETSGRVRKRELRDRGITAHTWDREHQTTAHVLGTTTQR